MKFNERLEGLIRWGNAVQALIEEWESQPDAEGNPLKNIVQQAHRANAWFLPENSLRAVKSVAKWLDREEITSWTSAYPVLKNDVTSVKSIGIVMAGNIPAVGFHDLLCVLVSGNKAVLKLSSTDQLLIPFLLDVLFDVAQEFKSFVQISYKLTDIDAVIATGSNNSARYFEYYFGKYPHIIRKNRNSVAVLRGKETEEDFLALGDDIFSYFGLGCRNVSKLYVPPGYDFGDFFRAIEVYGARMMDHNKYMNNYDYHRALFLLNSDKFLTNNFLMIRQSAALATPVSVLNYEVYRDESHLQEMLSAEAENIQCVMGKKELPFGSSQVPGAGDYADRVDTLAFILSV